VLLSTTTSWGLFFWLLGVFGFCLLLCFGCAVCCVLRALFLVAVADLGFSNRSYGLFLKY
jgi:hypothetical protein